MLLELGEGLLTKGLRADNKAVFAYWASLGSSAVLSCAEEEEAGKLLKAVILASCWM
jgi:hypothetical protein